MQRSIMSFFYPTKEGKAKKPEKDTNKGSGRETEPPPKAALKEQNGVLPDSDSPVKRSGRKAAWVLSSEGEEEDEALSPTEDQKPEPDSPQGSPPNLAKCPKNSTSPMDISSSGIPKRLTARKQLPRRTEKPRRGRRKKKQRLQEKAPQRLKRGISPRHPLSPPKPPKQKPQQRQKVALRYPGKRGGQEIPGPKQLPPHRGCLLETGQKVPSLAVARTFEKTEEVSARLRMVQTLSNLLRSVVALSPPDLLPVLCLTLNRLGPPQQGLELGVGGGVLLKAVAQATGRQLESVRAEAVEKGDIGLVAENSRSTQRLMLPPPPLTTSGVFSKFRDIARLTKMAIIKGLFVACRHSEARFIARALSGRLRLGLAEQSVLAALSQAVSLTPPGQEFPPAVVDAGKGKTTEARKTWLEEQGMILKQTFCEVPDLDRIIPVLLEYGLERLPEHCRLSPGVLKRFEEAAFTCEFKYYGQRAQIHLLEGGEVKIFSRNQEDNTGKYPNIISRIPKIKLPSVTSFILDTEAVAWDWKKKQIQPFQVLTTRKRKEVDAAEIQVQVCLYAFDLIYLSGESLVREPLSQHRQLLWENFVETEGEFVFVTSLDTKDMEQIAEFLEQSVKDSCKGLMVKTLDVDATYEIAKRSHNWLKLKKDYLDGVGDTLDLVGGRGRRLTISSKPARPTQ
uniref:DNA ligase 1 n=1 Tax=Cavia porcellus TaxID=10141 RepID=H0VSI3_CAVPO